MDLIIDRLRRALRLEPAVFPEIANDESATGQAIGITTLALFISSLTGEGSLIGRVVGAIIFGVVGLFVWTGIVFVASRLFGGKATYIQLLRPMGYSAAPAALGIIPFLGIIGGIYSIIMQIRMVREVNQVSDGAAIGTILVPLVVVFIPIFIISAIIGVALLGTAIGS